MLETKIENLTIAIERLIATLETSNAKPTKSAKVETQPVLETIPEVEPEPVSEPKAAAPSGDIPSRDRLQAKCLELVKADRSNKDRITALIATHGDNGRLIKDIPDDALSAFLSDLEAL